MYFLLILVKNNIFKKEMIVLKAMIKQTKFRCIVLIFFFVFLNNSINGQNNTVGSIFNEGGAYDGYTLFSPGGNKIVYLIDNDGRIVHQWETEYSAGMAVYLQEDGSLIRAGKVGNMAINGGGAGGNVIKYNWSGRVNWTYTISDEFSRSHHDFEVLPNGNILILVWKKHELEEVLENGRNPDKLSGEKLFVESIVEIEPTGRKIGNVVWEWHAWDHLVQDFDDTKLNYGVVVDNPGKIDLNYTEFNREGADWQHANSISYNAELDQIMISVLNFDEVWIIDHNTTTEEAKGEKGNLIFRWGNPRTYGAGTADDQMLFAQHSAHWIAPGLPDEGKIMIFNNGRDRPDGEYTSVVKIEPAIAEDGTYQKIEENRYLPSTFFYEYMAEEPTDLFAWYISGAQQLPNGHLLICDGAHGTFIEIDENEEEVWRYVNPIVLGGFVTEQGQYPLDSRGGATNPVFRATKYGKNFPAFENKDLTPGSFIELDQILGIANLKTVIQAYPNPAKDMLKIQAPEFNNKIQLINMSGEVVFDREFYFENIEILVVQFPRGIYQLMVNQEPVAKVILTN